MSGFLLVAAPALSFGPHFYTFEEGNPLVADMDSSKNGAGFCLI
jgi:hypothetical protein